MEKTTTMSPWLTLKTVSMHELHALDEQTINALGVAYFAMHRRYFGSL
jgi:hypothetical protein